MTFCSFYILFGCLYCLNLSNSYLLCATIFLFNVYVVFFTGEFVVITI